MIMPRAYFFFFSIRFAACTYRAVSRAVYTQYWDRAMDFTLFWLKVMAVMAACGRSTREVLTGCFLCVLCCV